MNLCPHCSNQISPGANFCNHCGTDLRLTTKECPSCRHKNPAVSVMCHDCGYQFGGSRSKVLAYMSRFAFTFQTPSHLPDQVKAQFFKFLRERIFEEQDGKKYSDYVARFYDSKFREIFEVRARQIMQELLRMYETHGLAALPDIDRVCYRSFDGLADFFLIQYCPDLNQYWLPAEILKYEKFVPGRTNTWDMIRDYLDFSKEREVCYFDFLAMDEKLLQNAVQSFLRAEKGEKLYFICDLSLNGNCKEGLAMTNQGIYWKLRFGKPKGFKYDESYQLEKSKNWIEINESHLMVNPAFDLKLFKLLMKLMPDVELFKKSMKANLV